MILWHIKQDGQTIGAAKGRNKAVDWLESELSREHLGDGIWENYTTGDIQVYAQGRKYTIERSLS